MKTVKRMKRRIFISEVDDHSKAGSERGYSSEAEAFRVAEGLAKRTGWPHCVGEYEFTSDGEWDCFEVLGYEHPE